MLQNQIISQQKEICSFTYDDNHHLNSLRHHSQQVLKQSKQLEITFPKNQIIGIEEANQVSKIIESNLKLQSLKILSRNNNQINSDGFDLIWSNLSKKSEIQNLSIETEGINSIKCCGFQSLGKCLQKLIKLRELSIKILRNDRKDFDLNEFAQELKYLNNLTSLKLKFNRIINIGYEKIEELTNSFKNLTNLKYLSLKIGWQSKILQQGALYIGLSLKNLIKIEYLIIKIDSDNNICSQGLIGLCEGIKQLENLISLKILIGFQNKIDNEGIKELGITINSLKNLQEIFFQLKVECRNKSIIIGSGFQFLNFPNLTLNLIMNHIGDNQIIELEKGFQFLNQIKNIQLKFNQFTSSKVDILKRCFQNMTQLESLVILINSTQRSDEQIGNIFQYLKSLKLLNLRFEGPKDYKSTIHELECFSKGLKQLKNLDSLSLEFSDQNKLSENSFEDLMQGLKELKKLTKLKLLVNIDKFDVPVEYDLASTLNELNKLTQLSINISRQIYFQTSIAQNVGYSFKNLSQITHLSYIVNENALSLDNNAIILGQGLGYLNKLTDLYLLFGKDNKVSLEGIKDLSTGIAQLQQLKRISLTFLEVNYFCQDSAQHLGKSLGNLILCESLELKIKQNEFDYETIKNLYNGIKQMNGLSQVNLDIYDIKSILFVKLIQDLPLVTSETFYLVNQPQLMFEKEINHTNQTNQNNHINNLQVKKLELQVELLGLKLTQFNYDCISQSFRDFKCLTYLSLQIEEISLGEEAAELIGDQLQELQDLTNLYLKISSNNYLGSKGSQSIGEGINRLAKLEYLYLFFGSFNSLGTEGSSFLAKSIENLKLLKEFTFIIGQNNNFHSESMIQLGQSLSQLANIGKLTILISKKNVINQEAAIALSQGLKNLIKLTELNLQIMEGKDIGCQGIQSIVDSLIDKVELKKLSLDLDEPQSLLFFELLQHNIQPENIRVSNNFINIINMQKFNNKITELTVQVTQNPFSCQGMLAFSLVLSNFIYLDKLDCKILENKISNIGAQHLGSALSKLIKLNYLQLEIHPNEIGQEGATAIFDGIKSQIDLKELHLNIYNNNFIGEEGIESLGTTFQFIVNLKKLFLQIGNDNNVGSRGFIGLGKGLSHLQQLENISLILDRSITLGQEAINTIMEGIKQNKMLQQIQFNLKDQHILQALLLINKPLFQHLSIPQIEQLQFQKLGEQLVQLSFEVQSQEIGVEGARNLSESLSTFLNLIDLKIVIRENNIRCVGAEYLGMALKSLKNLTKLYLKINDNQIKCQGAKQISESIGTLSQLKSLAIIYSKNQILEMGGITIGESLQNLIQLENLQIHINQGNNIGQEGAKCIGQNLKYLVNLISFDLFLAKDNIIQLEGAKAIVNELSKLNNLKSLIFNVEDYSGAYIISLLGNNKRLIDIQQPYINIIQSQLINQDPYLLHFDSSNSNYEKLEEVVQAIGIGLGQLVTLKKLRISLQRIYISSAYFTGFSKGIQTLELLEELQISIAQYGSIQSLGAIAFGQAIGKMTNLINLDLQFGQFNFIKEEGAVALGQGLGNLLHLKQLYLSIERNNGIDMIGAQGIYNGIKNLKNLQKLTLKIDNYASVIFILLVGELPLIAENQIILMYFSQIQFQKNEGLLTQLKFNITYMNEEDKNGGVQLFQSLGQLNLSKLKGLEIISYYDILNNESTIELGQTLSKLSSLDSLKILTDSTKLLLNGAQSFSNGIEALTNLKELHLCFIQKSSFTEKGSQQLFKSLVKLENLNELFIQIQSKLGLETCSLQLLQQAFTKLTNLSSLTLLLEYSQNLNDNLSLLFEEGIIHLTNLNYFHLKLVDQKQIIIEQNYSQSIEKVLPLLQKLSHLNLQINSQNRLKLQGINQIYNGVKTLKNLKYLELDFNDDFNILLFKIIFDLPLITPTQLNISNIKVIKIIKSNDPYQRDQQGSYEELNLYCNHILQFDAFVELTQLLISFTNLKKLTLCLNLQTNIEGQTLVKSLLQLPLLKSLILNVLSDQISYFTDQIQQNLYILKNLTYLDYSFKNQQMRLTNKIRIYRNNKRLVIMK